MSKTIEKWPSKCSPSSAKFETLYLHKYIKHEVVNMIKSTNIRYTLFSLMLSSCTLPGEKQSSVCRQMSWIYSQNVVRTNQIVRLLTIV